MAVRLSPGGSASPDKSIKYGTFGLEIKVLKNVKILKCYFPPPPQKKMQHPVPCNVWNVRTITVDVEIGWEMGDWIYLTVRLDQVLGCCQHVHESVHM